MKWMVCLLFAVIMLSGCSSAPTISEEPIELGWINRSVLNAPEHQAFSTVYDTVRIQEPFIAMLKSVVGGVRTVVFLGTWCSDSRREVPRFLKVADEAGMPRDSVTLFAVDRSKISKDGTTGEYRIERVPTFIFFKEGKEIGRIVESPEATMEQDMVRIFAMAAAGAEH
jgi:thiol-disulfide isomerase/thioredoxin